MKINILNNISFRVISKPFYGYDYYGNETKFENRQDAAKVANVQPKAVGKFLEGKAYSVNGYVFGFAEDMEIESPYGERVVDPDKILELLGNFSNTKDAPVCTINCKGEVKRYENAKQLIKTEGFDQSVVYGALSRENSYYSQGRLIIVKENDILLRDEFGRASFNKDGNPIYDKNKIFEKMKIYTNGRITPVVARHKDTDEEIIFSCMKEAQDYFKVTRQHISQCLADQDFTCKDYCLDRYDIFTIMDILDL